MSFQQVLVVFTKMFICCIGYVLVSWFVLEGIHMQGIYRKTPSPSNKAALKASLDRSKLAKLNGFDAAKTYKELKGNHEVKLPL